MTNNLSILSTASLSATLRQQAAEHGLKMDVVSFIRIVTEPDDGLRQFIKELVLRSATVVFTSANAVRPVGRWLHHPPNWQIYSISGATRDAVLECFKENNIVVTGNNAGELVAEILHRTPEQVIFFCGKERMDTIPAQLQAAGIRVEERVVYRTELAPQRVRDDYDAVLFFSPSGVKSFFSFNTVGNNAVLFAIGPSTAAAIAGYVPNHTVTAATPSKGELIETLIRYYDQRK